MSQILTPGERVDAWNTLGDLLRRIDALEALDPCACTANQQSLEEVVLATPCLAGFWKFADESGDIATDSFDGWNMDSGAYLPPTWGQAAGPPGEPSAAFGAGIGERNASFPALSADLTLEMWAKRADLLTGQLLGQGDPVNPNTSGVSIAIGAFNEGAHNRPKVWIGDNTGGPHGFEADQELSTGVWAYIVATREAHIWTLYVNGVAQSGTYDDGGTNYNAATGIWAGNPVSFARPFNGDLSYGAAYNCALSAEQIAEHYEVGISGGFPDGYVWTLVGGVGMWAPSTIEVEF